MILYVKSHKDFKTTHKAYAQVWNVPIMASTQERGTIVIPYEGRKDFAGDIAFFRDHLFLIDESAPKDGTVELTVADMSKIFARQMPYPDAEFFEKYTIISYGDFIENVIIEYFIGCQDPMYEIPYIEIANTDTTEFEEPKLTSTGLFSLTDVIATAREKGVLFNFYIPTGRNVLSIDISSPITTPHNVKFDDGHAILENETFSSSKTAKITAQQATETSGVYSESTWYLSKSGESVPDDPPEERAEGDWIYIQVGKDEDV